MIIGLSECQEESENILCEPRAAVAAFADAEGQEPGFDSRPGYPYFTLRGDEESSVLVGVRQESGNALQLLDWGRRGEHE